MELGHENPHFVPSKYPKMQYFTNNGPETPQNWYKPYISMFLHILGYFDTIYIQQYQNRMELGTENHHFGPSSYLKIQYFTNIGRETPQNWCKPYISMLLQIIRIFSYYLHTIIPKSYGDRARKSPFWALKIPPNAIFHK